MHPAWNATRFIKLLAKTNAFSSSIRGKCRSVLVLFFPREILKDPSRKWKNKENRIRMNVNFSCILVGWVGEWLLVENRN